MLHHPGDPAVTALRAMTVELQTEEHAHRLWQDMLTLKSRSLTSVETAFPFLQDATSSDPHLPTKHAPADVVDVAAEEECKVLQLLEKILIHFPNFWDAAYVPFKKAGGTYNSESEVLFVVSEIIRAVIEGLDLTTKLALL